jgi:hypothetical protein
MQAFYGTQPEMAQDSNPELFNRMRFSADSCQLSTGRQIAGNPMPPFRHRDEPKASPLCITLGTEAFLNLL